MTAAPATAGPRKSDTVRTVLGDLPIERLGRCDYHEHLFQVSPLLLGDEIDDEQASMQEAESLRRPGIDAFIDVTPTGLGRDTGAVARISHSTGIAVVHVSGAHHQGHYGSTHWLLDADENDLGQSLPRRRPRTACQPRTAPVAATRPLDPTATQCARAC
jgi:5-phospho-D-xylono-1,4-lactonase